MQVSIPDGYDDAGLKKWKWQDVRGGENNDVYEYATQEEAEKALLKWYRHAIPDRARVMEKK